MDVINRSICLEDFISREFGYSPSFPKNSLVIESDIKERFLEDDYNDYGCFPYDLIIPDNDRLIEIKDDIPLVKNLDGKYILRHKNAVNVKNFLGDIISGKTYNRSTNEFEYNTKYYILCNRDGDRMWIEMTDEMWQDLNDGNDVSQYDKFFFTTSDGKSVVSGLYKMTPYLIHYYYYALDGSKYFLYGYNRPFYYISYYKDDDGKIQIPVEKSMIYPTDTYCYSYNMGDESKLYYVKNLNDVPYKFYSTLNVLKMTIDKEYYEIIPYTYDDTFKVGDIIGVNENADEYNQRFCHTFEWKVDYGTVSYIKTINVTDMSKVVPQYKYLYHYTGEDTDEFKKDTYYQLAPSQDRFRYDLLVLNKIDGIFNKKRYDFEDFSEPFVDLTFYVEEEFDDAGILSPVIFKWEANEPYKINDIINYNDYAYRLKDLDKSLYEGLNLEETLALYTENGYIYDKVEVDKQFYETNLDNDMFNYRMEYDDKTETYYLYDFYYKGYYSTKSRISYLDEVDDDGEFITDENGEYKHWKRTFVPDETEGKGFTAICGSKIDNLRRFKRAFDDDGNILPFCFKYSAVTTNTGIKDIVLKETELEYMLGKSNIYDDECSFLYKVNIYMADDVNGTNEELLTSFNYDPSVQYTGYTQQTEENPFNYISASEIEESIDGITGKTFVIEFKYIVDATINTDKDYGIDAEFDDDGECITLDNGIRYKDKYTFTISTYSCLESEYYGDEYVWDEYTLETEEYINEDGDTETELVEYPDYEYEIMPDASSDFLGKKITYIGETTDDETFVSGNTYICHCVFDYVNINYGSTIITGITEGNDYRFSEISFDDSHMAYDNFQEVDTIKDDALIGIQNFKKDIDIYIDRGTSAASERIFGLGEISTFEQLTKYRGDMYDLQSQNGN